MKPAGKNPPANRYSFRSVKVKLHVDVALQMHVPPMARLAGVAVLFVGLLKVLPCVVQAMANRSGAEIAGRGLKANAVDHNANLGGFGEGAAGWCGFAHGVGFLVGLEGEAPGLLPGREVAPFG